DNQPFGRTHDDPERIRAVEEHAGESLEKAIELVQEALRECVQTLRAIPAEGWRRTARHARRGELTVEQFVDMFLVEHVEEHRRQAEATIARLQGAGG